MMKHGPVMQPVMQHALSLAVLLLLSTASSSTSAAASLTTCAPGASRLRLVNQNKLPPACRPRQHDAAAAAVLECFAGVKAAVREASCRVLLFPSPLASSTGGLNCSMLRARGHVTGPSNATLAGVLDAGRLARWYAEQQQQAGAAPSQLVQGRDLPKLQQQLLAGLRLLFASASVSGGGGAAGSGATTHGEQQQQPQRPRRRRRRSTPPGAGDSGPGRQQHPRNSTSSPVDSAPTGRRLRQARGPGKRPLALQGLARRRLGDGAAAAAAPAAPAAAPATAVLYRQDNSVVLQARPGGCLFQYAVVGGQGLLGAPAAQGFAGRSSGSGRGSRAPPGHLGWWQAAGAVFVAVSVLLGLASALMVAQIWRRYNAYEALPSEAGAGGDGPAPQELQLGTAVARGSSSSSQPPPSLQQQHVEAPGGRGSAGGRSSNAWHKPPGGSSRELQQLPQSSGEAQIATAEDAGRPVRDTSAHL